MRHWKNISVSLATLCARLSSVAGLLVINGLASRRMTHEQFGLWQILLSMSLFCQGLDFGFRFTLGNRIAALGAGGEGAEAERRETFLAITYLQVAIAAALIALALALLPYAPWEHWFKIKDPLLIAQTRRLMPLVISMMLGCLPLALMWTVFFGYHEIKLASSLSAVSALLQTALFVGAIYRFKFTWVVAIYFASNLGFGFALTVYVIIRRRWKVSPLPPARILEIARSMWRISFHSFLLTLSYLSSMILGPIVSGAVSGLASAADFALVQKLFSFMISAHQALLAPLSPAVTLESHSGNWDAVRRRMRVAVFQIWPAIFFLGGGVILCVHPLLIHLWAGKWLRDYPLAALLLAWACLNGFINTFTVFLNSLGLVKVQAAVSIAMLLPSLLVPVLMGRWLGAPGVPLAQAICLLPAAIIWPIYTRRALRLRLIRV
jgi:O-antigen/teichoic acid export membrane protein